MFIFFFFSFHFLDPHLCVWILFRIDFSSFVLCRRNWCGSDVPMRKASNVSLFLLVNASCCNDVGRARERQRECVRACELGSREQRVCIMPASFIKLDIYRRHQHQSPSKSLRKRIQHTRQKKKNTTQQQQQKVKNQKWCVCATGSVGKSCYDLFTAFQMNMLNWNMTKNVRHLFLGHISHRESVQMCR